MKKILTNAVWNVVNGMSGALVAVAVPPVLTRTLAPEAYAAWALALQIGTYVSLFGFGVQVGVARYVAYFEARGEEGARNGIVATAFWFLGLAGCVGLMAVAAMAVNIDVIMPQLPLALFGQARAATLLVGLALAINLPASVFAGVFIGRQQSRVPALIQVIGRMAQAMALIAVSVFHNIVILGAVYTAVSAGIAVLLWQASVRSLPRPQFGMYLVAVKYGRELGKFCLSLTVWNLAMMLVSGLDLAIVGRYDYGHTAFYAVSVTLTNFVSGTLSSLGGALTPATASMTHEDGGLKLRQIMIRSSRLIAGAALIVAAPLIVNGNALLRLWVGVHYADAAAPILAGLTLATLLRFSAITYATIAVGMGMQRQMIFAPLIEGGCSLVLALATVKIWGGYGVAWSKLISASIGLAALVVQHVLRESLGMMSRWRYVHDCLIRPNLCLIPTIVIGFAFKLMLSTPSTLLGAFGTALAAAISVWTLNVEPVDRAMLATMLRKFKKHLVF